LKAPSGVQSKREGKLSSIIKCMYKRDLWSCCISHSFLNKTLTAKLSVRNPFNIFEMKLKNSGPKTSSTIIMTREANVFKISISYKINNYKPSERNNEKQNNTSGTEKF
jgi:hypothetical protein